MSSADMALTAQTDAATNAKSFVVPVRHCTRWTVAPGHLHPGRTRSRPAHAMTLALAATCAVLLPIRAQPVRAVSDGITGYSGKQSDTCNTSCHGGGVAPTVGFEGPTQVVTGALATFRFVVQSHSAEQDVAGFNVAASDGVLGVLPGNDEQLQAGELTHLSPQPNTNGEAFWDFTWQAPSTPGTQILYGAGLSANDNGNRDGDDSEKTTFPIIVIQAPRGDANCDGTLSAADVTAATMLLPSAQPAACNADTDCDGVITPRDVGRIVTALFEPASSVCIPTATPTFATPMLATATATPSATGMATTTMSPLVTRTPTPAPPPNGTVTATASPPRGVVEWATYGQNQQRTFYNAYETRITRDNVADLRFKWRYLTGAIVTASPTVAYVDVPGEGRIKIVFVVSWDGTFYALRASNGSQLWHYTMKPQPGASYPYASSAEVTTVAGEQRVYAAGGMTMYCLAAATGAVRWEFDAGTGCTTCDRHTDRNEIESSPTVVDNLVYFAMDVNDSVPGKGGVYGLDANNGRLIWYFDMDTQTTCRPYASDNVRRFDGFHSAAELGLPADFFTTRPGCNFDRSWTGCGNIWSSFAVDDRRRMIYTASGNCDTDNDPSTPDPPPPMPPYDEAIFALTFDGAPVWTWQPRPVDPLDVEFGGVPNLFTISTGGAERDVVGVGAKDGNYYVLDRYGTNPLTGRIEPYWHTQTVPGGPIGGIIASAAVGGGDIFFSTAIGYSVTTPQQPAAWSLNATNGSVRWARVAAPSYGPTTAIPGVTFMGGIFFNLTARDADTGAKLQEFPLGAPVASAATIVDGEVFVGAGVGARDAPDSQEYQASLVPSYISALCLPTAGDCPETLCDDGDPCTYDFHTDQGTCRSEPAPDGVPCKVGSADGVCQAGTCHPRM